MKDEFSFDNPRSQEWTEILRNPSIWYKKKQGRFGDIPYSDYNLLKWLQSYWEGELIPCVCLFENQQHLSTQVPMYHKLYTNNRELCLINAAMRNVEVIYTDEFNDIKRLQELIVNLKITS